MSSGDSTTSSEPSNNSMLFNTMKFMFTGNDNSLYKFNLSNIYNSVRVHDQKLQDVLTKQNEVNDFLTTEMNRLTEKESQIDNARKGQKRVLMLNESYRMRQAEYTKLIIASVFVLASVILIKYLRASFAILPDAIYTLIHIIMFSGLIIYAMVIYIKISSREKTNFNRLDIPSPHVAIDAAEKLYEKRKNAGYLGVNYSDLCIGAACCNPDDNTHPTKWDEEIKKCVPSSSSS